MRDVIIAILGAGPKQIEFVKTAVSAQAETVLQEMIDSGDVIHQADGTVRLKSDEKVTPPVKGASQVIREQF